MEKNEENKPEIILSEGILADGILQKESQSEEIVPQPDIDRFIELYASFGIALKKQKKDGMYRLLITDVYSEKLKFTPEAGCVVWFELNGTFAKQVFYAK